MLVDSHCHLDAGEFDADRSEVILRAQRAGVTRQLVPAVTAASWPKLREVCGQAPGLFPAYGLHPVFLDAHREADLETLAAWIEREKPLAIGECGLDYFLDGLDRERQQRFFDGQLRLARTFQLPLIVHARRAVDAVIASIRRVGGLTGVVHSFSGSPEQAAMLHRHGFMLGLGGPVTYDRAQRLHRIARDMPLEQLLLETDAPDQPDAGIRGQRNEPARLPVIAAHIARLRGMEVDALVHATSENAQRLFGWR
ncbi:TatD DNase family protein [Xanthomonas sp. 60]